MRITVGKHSQTGKVTVLPDPRVQIDMEDRIAKDELRQAGAKVMARGAKVTDRLNKIKPEVDAVAAKIARMDKASRPKDLEAAAKVAKKAIDDFETALWGSSGGQGIVRTRGSASKIMRSSFAVSSSWEAPTAAEVTQIERAKVAVDELIESFNELLTGPIAKFNEALGKVELSFKTDTTEIK